MPNSIKGYLIIFFFFISTIFVVGQVPQFNMMDTTVYICKGDLFDSGGPGKIYGNNENKVFRICTGSPISMSFTTAFCVETNFDKLQFFDGMDTLTNPIGPSYSGNLPPPTIVATSGCLTVHFVSDSNVAYCGWQAHWTAPVIPPVPPVAVVSPTPVCNSIHVNLALNKPVRCDSLRAADFSISGPLPVKVIQASALSCVNNMTSLVQLTVDKPITQSCNYDIDYICRLHDNCDSIWRFVVKTNFFVNTCPFVVTLIAADDTICPGSCTNIKAIVSGCQKYTYTWSNGMPSGPGPFQVCPSSTSIYSVTVKDSSGMGFVANASHTISVLNPKIGVPNLIVCQSDTAFVIPASPPGGYWIGAGMTDTLAGIFTPDSAGPGNHYVKYVLGKLCRDSIQIKVKPINAGINDAACPFSSPFFVSDYKPLGGLWSGDSIQPNGLFTPADTGVYHVTYHFHGCSETKNIYVNQIHTHTTDTICQSVRPFSLSFYPPGGRWYGPGITDTLKGIFTPDAAGGGLQKPVYYLHGCRDTLPIFIKAIQAGYSFSACPLQPAFPITPPASPSGGLWSGVGITNPMSGMYDPSKAASIVVDMLNYQLPNGCIDTLYAYVVQTKLYVDSLYFCAGNNKLMLNYANTYRTPGGGTWTGNGVIQINGDDYFDPGIAGPGVHKLTYLVNTCADSLYAVVYPSLHVTDTLLCTITPPLQLQMMPAGGYWQGNGIIDSVSGIFNPALAGAGIHYIRFVNPVCTDSARIHVYTFVPAAISGLDSIYCFLDTNLSVSVSPQGGSLYMDSNLLASGFNPLKAGAGYHTLSYTFGTGSCITTDVFKIHVLPPLTTHVSVSKDTICKGDGASILVTPSGGKSGSAITYQWSHGLFPVSSHTVSPSTSTMYTIITSDGCSEPVTDSVYIYANPAFTVHFESSSIDCYGTKAYAKAIVIGNNTYEVEWGTSPVKKGDSILVNNGKRYTVTILDTLTGCHLDTLIDIPGFSVMKALFSVNPDMDCISQEENPVTFIDVSRNVLHGLWDFGNGQTLSYVKGQNPQVEYAPGNYTVTLNTSNEGGCTDSYRVDICVFGPESIFVPDAFSPNNDGQNDMLYVRGSGIQKLNFRIYDRWGENVFYTDRPEMGWDGNYRGQMMNTGVYYYYLEATLFNNKEVFMKGDISIIK